MKFASLLLLFSIPLFLLAQSAPPPPYTKAEARLQNAQIRQQLAANSLTHGLEFRNVGPTVQSGRVADLEVWKDHPTHFYVAYASGGLWKTTDNGISFSPLFQNESVMTIGDIAVDWERNVIWLGSGESNSSRSSYAGDGIYKSMDGGKSWQHLGLTETHHIGRILLHPDNPDIAWVAALGHLYSDNEERGVYKTEDGGKSWQLVLRPDNLAGAVDLLLDPQDNNTIFAATWQRDRKAWNFIESGSGSAIYKSTDGGNNWSRMSNTRSGFPSGEGTGRIGLAAGIQDGKTVLFAALDNYNRREKEEEEEEKLDKDALRSMDIESFLELKDYLVEDYLKQYRFPKKYSVESVKEMIKKEEISPADLVTYVEDANSLLFDTPVKALEIYRSDNGGRSWKKTHEGYLDNVYNSYGYYFGQIRVNPSDPQRLYVMGVPILRSDDGGKNWKGINGANVHADHHALWINPAMDQHLILGNDGGINISYDDGEHWIKCNSPAVGQFYTVAVDQAKPYRIYGGLQDNGVWMGPSTYKASDRWHQSGHYPYKMIMGGDGMQVAIDPRDNHTVYTGYQFGNYFRIDTHKEKQHYITPKPDLGAPPYRWNWQTPIHLSIHNPDILYMGANKLLRSLDQGDSFEEISADLTAGGRKGDVPYGTLSSIHESPLQFGLLYTGADDGLVHVSKDGGYSWQNINAGLPDQLWVSRIQASQHEKGRVYLALNGYRWDDFNPYLYVSEDYGQNWLALGTDLPLEPINVVKEDPVNPDILYVGTDHGLYISYDRGQSFSLMNESLPAVAVHDLVIQEQAQELVVGTHGRSIYVGSIKEVQLIDSSLMSTPLHAFKTKKMNHASWWGNQSPWWNGDPPQASFSIYTTTPGEVKVTVQTAKGMTLRVFSQDCKKGINGLLYDLKIDKKILSEYNKYLNEDLKENDKPVHVKPAKNGAAYIYKGTYKVLVEKDSQIEEVDWVVE
jgi:photosystem II stability/assembly factor-like uncharacterized protein